MKHLCVIRALAALVISISLTACGGGGGGGATAGVVSSDPGVPVAPSPSPPPTPTPPPPPPPPPLKYPIPGGLWAAPAGATPASGNYLYLQSDIGDYIGAGRTYSYSTANALMTLSTRSLEIDVGIKGDQNWDGRFLLPSAALNLQAGYFHDLTRTPFADPAVGGVDWFGEGRGCNTIQAWVAIDNIVLTGGVMTALDMRFEQHCEGGSAALHGQVHWNQADAASTAPGPQNPPPAGLWKPPASFVAPAGNYLYLASDTGDYIGDGYTQLFTPGNTTISVVPNLTAALRISAGGWTGNFIGMNTLSQLQPGYYGNLQRYPFNNAIRGGLDWSGNGRGCNTLTGWFVVDGVSYALGELTSIDLRFEQHCEGMPPAQHGVIHWAR